MSSSTDFLLALEGVSVSFDGFKAVDGLNLYIDKGELRVIIGPNGAGKATVLDLISGHTRVSEGSIKFKDQEISSCKEQEMVRRGIGRKFRFRPSTRTSRYSRVWTVIAARPQRAGRAVLEAHDAVIEREHQIEEMIFLKEYLERSAESLATARSSGWRWGYC